MPWRLKALLWTAAAAAAVAALVVFGLASERSSTAGRRAPALPRERLAGPTATLPGGGQGARSGPVAVTFWASWCGPCAREAPALERFSQSAAGRGRLIGVNWSDSLSGARAFVRHYRWSFADVRDGDGTVGNDYGITGLPTTFVLDSSGRIRDVLRGPQDEASLGRALARLDGGG
jgi:thiol-disulfide isomerase/thioredoxin